MYKTKEKPMTIKEYTKNFKFPTNNSKDKDKDKDNLNKSQNIFFYKILKNRKIGNISIDRSISKIIENTYHEDANKKKKILKNKNRKIPNTSYVMSPSNKNERNCSPIFFAGHKRNRNKEENGDSFFSNKIINYKNKTTKNSKKNINQYKSVTPSTNYKNRIKRKLNYNIDDKKK